MQSEIPAPPRVDLVLSVQGRAIPQDHAYFLYSALSRLLDNVGRKPIIHESTDLGVFPICGSAAGDGNLLLDHRSCLRLRTPNSAIPTLLALAGKRLDLAGFGIQVGVPRVEAIVPASVLACDMVLIKLARPPDAQMKPPEITPHTFLAAARKKLQELQIHGEPAVQTITSGSRKDQPRRRVMHVREQTHVGYAMTVNGLSAEESLRLQERGLGGRRVMGCGLFLPIRDHQGSDRTTSAA